MLTIKACRDKAGISEEMAAKMLNTGVLEYLDYENYVKEMDIHQGITFARLVNQPIDQIIFFAY